jgi:hypothetical protein
MAKSQEGRVEDIGRELGGRFKLTSLLQKQLREYVKGGRAFMPSVRNTHELVSHILDDVEAGNLDLDMHDGPPAATEDDVLE